MAPLRQDWAIVEWEFLRFDTRYRMLPDDSARKAYLHLWVTCVHLRRDIFERAEIRSPYMADMCGVTPELLLSMVEGSIAVGLCARGPRGSITVVGVQAKHAKLRGWNESNARFLCGPIEGLTGTGTETETEDSPEPPQAADSEPVCVVPYEDIREAWNNIAAKAGCVKCRDLTASRKQKIKTRWRDKGWRDHWLEAINFLPERKFALGENDRGWRMDIDFFLKPDTVTGIIEGKYAGGAATGKKPVERYLCSGCGNDQRMPGALGPCPSCGATGLCYGCRNNHDCGETKGDSDG